MTWHERLLSRFHYFDITDNKGSVYIRRYKLARTRFFNIYLHHIRRSDADRCLHDHPWNFVTFILTGGYREILPNGVRWRAPGEFFYRSANFSHRVEVDRPAWSLVFVGPRIRAWGFWTVFGWRRFVFGQNSPICETGRQTA